jgi:twitching motility protein PilJ
VYGFKIFSRGSRNAAQDAAANSEFGDSQFLHTAAGGAPAALRPRPADDGDAPLRLRDALGRRRNASAPSIPAPVSNCR